MKILIDYYEIVVPVSYFVRNRDATSSVLHFVRAIGLLLPRLESLL